jgi:hypothetical protein
MPAAAPQGGSDQFGVGAQQAAFEQGLKEQKAGIFGEAAAAKQLGQAQAELLKNQVEQQRQAKQDYEDHFNLLNEERKSFVHDLQNQHIDPNHYWQNKSTGGKIATAIGLILGGLGGGMQGNGGNAALDFLNHNINRDIESQKANLDKSNSLLRANMQQFGNLKDATDMTRAMQMDLVSNQLKQAAAQAADPMAKAKALQAAGALDAQSAPIIAQMAMRKSLLAGMKRGQVDANKIVEFFVPEGSRPAAKKELEEASSLVNAKTRIISAFDQLDKINTLGNRAAHLGFTPAAVDAIKGAIIPSLSKDTAGRYTESDAAALEHLFPAMGDSPKTIATKREQLIRLVTEKMGKDKFPTISAYGIPIESLGSGSGGIKESAPVK